MILKYQKNIFRVDGYEVVPLWKRCGKYNEEWNEDQKWLWDTGEFDHHMQPVGLVHQMFSIPYKLEDGSWYVWATDRFGDIHLTKDNKYMVRMRDGSYCWDTKPFDTIQQAARYAIKTSHKIVKSIRKQAEDN